MIAYILCGGLGTRLAPAWKGPKSLVPIEGRPFLHWQLDRIEQAGFTHCHLLTGHGRREVWASAVAWSRTSAMAICNVPDPEAELPDGVSWGTGHAVRIALREERQSPVLLMYGDVYPRGDVSAPLRAARKGKMVMAVSRDTTGRGNCRVDGDNVTAYGIEAGWLDAGYMAVHPEHFRRLQPMRRRRLEDWLTTFTSAGIVEALRVPASLDVGSLTGLKLARAALALKEAL